MLEGTFGGVGHGAIGGWNGWAQAGVGRSEETGPVARCPRAIGMYSVKALAEFSPVRSVRESEKESGAIENKVQA